MPKRPALETEVPRELLDELNAKLVAGGFSDYRGLTQWLNERLEEQGLEVRVSKTALHNHGSRFQEQFEADMAETRQIYQLAKACVGDDEDTEGKLREATIRALQTHLLKITTAVRQAERSGDDVHLLADTSAKITRAMADLGRLDISSQKWRQQVKAEAKREAIQEASAAASKAATKAGVSKDGIAAIRAAIAANLQ